MYCAKKQNTKLANQTTSHTHEHIVSVYAQYVLAQSSAEPAFLGRAQGFLSLHLSADGAHTLKVCFQSELQTRAHIVTHNRAQRERESKSAFLLLRENCEPQPKRNQNGSTETKFVI